MSSGEPDLRIGVVGVGSLGFHHARILRDLPETDAPLIFDVDTARTEFVSAELGLTPSDSLDHLFDWADALVVAVPTTEHEAIATAALEQGVHVLIEKPMAPSLDAADRILEAAKNNDGLVQIGHSERFNSAILAAEEHLDSPLFIESHRLAPFVPRSTDVAVVLDLMIHDVDLVQSLVGSNIQEIAAVGLPVLTSNVDIANARLTFVGGAVANLTASRVSTERMRKLRIFQKSGYISLDLAEGKGEFLRLTQDLPGLSGDDGGLLQIPEGGLQDLVERIPIQGEGQEPLRKELENFRNAVMGREQPVVTGEAGRAALAATLSIEDRIKSHVSDSRPA
ncbi:MAG: Gfo/Idh/MocA family oxidoreductase [Gemmatimonadetes bacterium]|nr:Gfo/Idh/MocA family oxidoreductase [Gemmatimonadota bacterium]